MTGFWFNWNFDFCDLIITNGFNSELVIEPINQEMIGCVEFIGNFNNNENMEFGFEIIFKNVAHWNFDN